MIRKGTFTSVWDNDRVHITTEAELDTETGEIVYCESVDVSDLDLDILEKEYFTDSLSDEKFEVCTTCHEYILQWVDEIEVCSNPDCDNHN